MIESKRQTIKLKWRILIGYAIPILLSFGVVSVIYYKATHVVELTAAVETTQLQMEGVDQIIVGISKMLRNVRMSLLYPELEDYESLYKQAFEQFT
ncbi:MAG: chemotaxis protein, partial [Arthrospira platensis PCC 7345]|nr:chemotaxis protein [Arthrospira platensis PCC 7345]